MTNADTKRHAETRPQPQPGSASRTTWRYAVAGLSASLVGLGLARFSYTPLIPALIAAKWFSASNVVYLGAANLAGYLAGALAARVLATRIGAVRALRAMMLLATLSFFASSAPLSFSWFFAWRFLAGLTGGIIMVLAASVILPHTSAARRGIGHAGAIVAATGFAAELVGLGMLSALLTLASWWNWPAESKADAAPAHPTKPHRRRPLARC
ncbi:YbfB/YjiJ family MFS transporter [Bradyrhizobium liaoningense]